MKGIELNADFVSYQSGPKLVDNLTAKADRQTEENGALAAADVVDISESAKALSIGGTPAGAAEEDQETEEVDSLSQQLIKSLRKQIEALKEEIEEIEQGTLPKEMKEKMLAAKKEQLAELQMQLQKAMEEEMKNSTAQVASMYA